MRAKDSFTLRDLENLAGESTPRRISIGWMFAANHTQRVRLVEWAIDWISQEHTKTRQHRYKRSEDALTVDVITDLKALGFTASHDQDYGGHSDIVIEARGDFLWLGEAKKHSTYSWLLQGFQQLDTRYATALPGQDHGGLIIYSTQQRVDQIMDKWCAYLVEQRPDVTVERPADNPLIWWSTHQHKATGLSFRVRHVPISLYFNPEDKG